MAGLKIIKRRISSVKSTQQVTRVMKMVAAAKLRRAQEAILRARPYSHRLRQVIRDLSSRVDRSLHPLLAVRPVDHVGIVVVTGDRGLAGAFNVNVLKRTQALMKDYRDIKIDMIVVGRKGSDFFARRGANIVGKKVQFFNTLHFGDAMEIGGLIESQYLNGSMDRVFMVYNEFKSVMQQNVVAEQLLPIEPDESQHDFPNDIIFEPSELEILNAILPKFLNVQIWRVLLESYSAEMAARMTAMENATKNAGDLIDQLTLHYNKARQASITNQILEVVAGAEGLK